jgi:DNA-binding GntR family transcriptional regulator
MAYDAMKSAIMAHKFEVGDLYNEGQVSKELGISKTPIHQALIELESEGFLTLLPRKGFQIRILTETLLSQRCNAMRF